LRFIPSLGDWEFVSGSTGGWGVDAARRPNPVITRTLDICNPIENHQCSNSSNLSIAEDTTETKRKFERSFNLVWKITRPKEIEVNVISRDESGNGILRYRQKWASDGGMMSGQWRESTITRVRCISPNGDQVSQRLPLTEKIPRMFGTLREHMAYSCRTSICHYQTAVDHCLRAI